MQFVPVATSALAFVAALFLRWRRIEDGKEKQLAEQSNGQEKGESIPVVK
jgi:hypothetical protein